MEREEEGRVHESPGGRQQEAEHTVGIGNAEQKQKPESATHGAFYRGAVNGLDGAIPL